MEDLNDINEEPDNPFANDNESITENVQYPSEKDSINNKKDNKKKFINRLSSIKDIFKGKISLKNNPNNNKLKINFNKYLVNTESFANNIKDHQEENLFVNNKSKINCIFIN